MKYEIKIYVLGEERSVYIDSEKPDVTPLKEVIKEILEEFEEYTVEEFFEGLSVNHSGVSLGAIKPCYPSDETRAFVRSLKSKFDA